MYADIYHRHGKRRNVSERNRSATGVNGRTARRWAAAEQRPNRAAQPPPLPSRRSGPTDTLPALAGKCPSGSDAFKSVCAPRRTADAQAGTRRKEEPIRKTSRTVVRNERYRKNAIGVRERHNERKNEAYSNPDVLLEYSGQNVVFKTCGAPTYAQQFDRMVAEGAVSTRGLKPDAYVFDEMVFDVNTEYFERHGGYEYAKKFYAEAYELAKQIAGGEQYVISAVMHADERNREASDRLGKDVFHYHMHVIYLPVVEKEIRWSKRCRDPALRGTVRETVMQVSHSKKWPMVPATDETGRPVLKKDGRPRLVSSYSLLQTAFYEHMKAAGFTDFERGIEGSTAEHLDVLEYKVKQDRQVVQELRQEIGDLGTQAEEARKQRDELRGEVTAAAGDLRAVQADIGDVRQMHGRSRRRP